MVEWAGRAGWAGRECVTAFVGEDFVGGCVVSDFMMYRNRRAWPCGGSGSEEVVAERAVVGAQPR